MPQALPIIAVVGTVVSVAGSLIGGMQQQSAANAQAAFQQQQAEQARQIANYNAEIQRQNAEVAYQMQVAQSQANQNIMQINAAMQMQNAAFAEVQAFGARQQYEQGMLNAKQQEIEGEASRRQGEEEARRKREENARSLAMVRSKYAASGVTMEGSPLEVLGDAARIAETAVQDVAYTTELSSRKQYREAEIKKFEAGFSLIDEAGFKVQASNYRNEALISEYRSDLYGYESAIAGASFRIKLNEARLTEIAGEEEARGYEFASSMSRYQGQMAMTGSMFGAASSLISGVGSAFGGGKSFGGFGGGAAPTAGLSFGGAKSISPSSLGGGGGYFRW
jgi:hypothetical protein